MSQDSWENFATLGALIVVAGVALEGVDWYAKFKNRNRRSSVREKEPCWTLAVEFFSITLVVLGLCLEIFATYKASLKARDKINQLTSDLTIASDKAASAAKDAGDSKVFAAQIGTTNAQLVASNALLSSKVEELRLNNIALLNELVFALSPWELGINSSIFVPLMPFSNMVASVGWCTSTFRFSADSMIPTNLPGNLDSMRVADEIANNLEIAGWKVEHTHEYDVPPGTGVYVEVNHFALGRLAVFEPMGTNAAERQMSQSEHNRIWDLTKNLTWRADEASRALVADLTNHGIAAQDFPGSSKQPVGTVRIMVGPKPNPFNEIRRMAEEQRFDEIVQKQLGALNPTNSLRRNVPISPK